MYLIFPPEYEGLADAVFTKAQQSYHYTTKKRESGLVDSVGKGTLVVTTYDRDAAKSEDEVSQYRWSILEAMALGAVFVHFDDVDEAHFFTPDDELTIEQQIEKILVAGRYAEARSNFFAETSPKALYVGPTYVNPLAVAVLKYDAKKEDYTLDYFNKTANVLASLPDDLWPKVGFISARMPVSLHKVLDEFYDTAVLAFDARSLHKVESYKPTKVNAPKNIDLEFGVNLNTSVKKKDVVEEEKEEG